MSSLLSMRKTIGAGSMLALSVLCFSTVSFAQPAGPEWTQITITKVRPDMHQEYEDVIKNEIMPAYKKAGIAYRNVYQAAVFGDSNEYVTITPIAKFAQYDTPNPLIAAMGQEASTRTFAKLRKCEVERRSIAQMGRPDLSIMKEMKGELGIAVVSFVRIFPGKSLEYENWLKSDYLPALKKADVDGYWVSQTVFGGDVTEYTTVAPLKKFADLDAGPPLTRALGKAGADKVLAKASGIVMSAERRVMRQNKSLSYFTPPAPKTTSGN